MLQQDKADDYVIGTGIAHMVREFCEIAFSTLDLDYQDYVVVDPAFVRPPEKYPLVADPSHAKRILGWQSETSFEQLVQMMVEADLKALVE